MTVDRFPEVWSAVGSLMLGGAIVVGESLRYTIFTRTVCLTFVMASLVVLYGGHNE